mgnify:CR=1 FL=1
MANNVFYVKRTSTSGRTPNTTGSYATNTQYIAAGELALNMADGILYTSNGSTLIEIGANNTNQSVTGTLTIKAVSANGSTGTSGQVLTSNGTSTYWSSVSSGATGVRQQYTANGSQTVFTVTGGYTATQLDVYVNGVKLYNGTEVDVSNGSTFTISSAPPNGALIEVAGYTISAPSNYMTNVYSGTMSGQITFSNTITVGALSANGSVGANAQVLTSNGSATFWNTLVGVNTAAQYSFSNTITFQNTITFSSQLSIGSNLTVNTSTFFLGNSTVNTSVSANQITLNGSNVVTTATALKVYYANGTQAFP